MTKPKIAVIGLKGLPASGGAAAASENVVHLLKHKYDYTIYSISTHTDNRGMHDGYFQIVFKGCRGKRLNTFLYYFKSLIHVLFMKKYDLIQVNHTSCGFIVPFLRLKYKVVATAHGIVPKDDNKWNLVDKNFFNFFSFLFFRFSNVPISVAKPHIEIFKKYTIKPIIHIPNGISIPFESEPEENRENYLLFAASRIIALKGCHILLQALRSLSYKDKLLIIGNLDHTPKYAQKLQTLGEGLNIEFRDLIKHKEHLNQVIRKSRLFIFPSFNEGMSNMLLEVASLKTPLICSDIPENKAIFDDTMVLFFKTGDSNDLAEKIIFALSHPEIMHKQTEAAYNHLSNEYHWKNIAKQYENIYDRIISKK